MAISIIANTAAAITNQNIRKADDSLQRSISKISSGQRVFSAQEDAAALAIGAGLKVDVSALRAAQINIGEATAALQIADGALSQVTDILIRLGSLTTMAQSDQLSSNERGFLNLEYQQMLEEIDRITALSEFNGFPLLGGQNVIELNPATLGANVDADNGFVGFKFDNTVNTADVFEVQYIASTQVLTITNATQSTSQTLYVQTPQPGALANYNFAQVGVEITLNSDFIDTVDALHLGAGEEFSVQSSAVAVAANFEFQVGTSTTANDRISITMPVTNTNQLTIAGTDVTLVLNAASASDAVDFALLEVTSARSVIGANINRLQAAASNVAISIENNESARAALLDVDVTQEITNISSQQVLMEAAINMLTRANEQPRNILRLLQG